jgi:hypothetical protein
MILYVNGDSHTAAAEAVVPHGFACDDSQYYYLGQVPHPDNLAVSWGKKLSDMFDYKLHCHAQSGCSNDRIIRTTTEFIHKFQRHHKDWFMIIQWSTWEREEWFHDGIYYQVGSSGMDSVPLALQDRYKNFIANVDWQTKTQNMHEKIVDFHEFLNQHQIKHVFFNGNNNFESISHRYDWGVNYLDPYNPQMTYDRILKNNKYRPLKANSYHYGKEAHSFFAQYMLQYITDNKILESSK